MTTADDETDASGWDAVVDPSLPPVSPELSGRSPPPSPERTGRSLAPSPEPSGVPVSPELSGVPVSPELSGRSPAPSPELSGQAWDVPSPDLMSGAAAPPEPPLLPPAYSESQLRDAVGATPRTTPRSTGRRAPTPFDEDDDPGAPGKPRSRKTIVVSALSLFGGLAIAALVFLGRANSARYVIACEADQVVVEQGRSFPPWGTHSLDGAEWKPLKIPPEAECHPRDTEQLTELASWYLTMVIDQASSLLTAREVTKVDDAEAQLKQALLVTRELAGDDDRRDKRKEIERLLGDVVYWRASAKLRTAADAMTEAAKQFEVAAAQRPRHVSDASAWATHARKLAEELRTGPSGAPQATFPPLPPAERPGAPAGVALPVEPEHGTAERATEPAPSSPPADAGLPTGGVLL